MLSSYMVHIAAHCSWRTCPGGSSTI